MAVLKELARYLLTRRAMARVNSKLYMAALHGLGVLNYENGRISGEDYLLEEFLPSRIRKQNPVLFDVGANVGGISVQLSKSFPTGKIYAFEPHPLTYSKLRENTHAIGRVQIENIALGREAGAMTLYDRSDISGSAHASIYKDVIAEIHGQTVTSVEIKMDTLAEYAARVGVKFIDYLKVDTEGNELAVLEGGRGLLNEDRIGFIHFEFNEMNVVSRVFMRDFRLLLPRHSLFRLLPRGLLPLDPSRVLTSEIFAFQNIVAVPQWG